MSKVQKPVAWLHTLYMERGQTDRRVTFTSESPFGICGKDYDPTYRVKTVPLVIQTKQK